MSTLACPLDLLALARGDATYTCALGHSYDVAREGYVNLLPPGKASRKTAGDDKESIAARRRFLNAGHYQALADAVVTAVGQHPDVNVLDVGCGEGYYTARLRGRVVGVDISTPGIKAAARTYPQAVFAVGNALALPVVAGSVDVAVSVFAPVGADEFARVLAPGGRAVIAVPGAQHLAAVRNELYQHAQPHDEAVPLADDDRFTLVATGRVEAEITLAMPAVLHDLLAMTPYRFAVPPEALARASAAPTPLLTPISFLISTFVLRD